jgi:15-cis-phytoene synthase
MTPPAVRYCEEVTRRRARNFWYGIRLLPRPKREALAAVYAMARRIDDVGDGGLAPTAKLASLDRIEKSLGKIGAGSKDPVLAALGLAAERFPLPVGAFRDLLEGVRMDVRGTGYRVFDDVVLYGRRVAGSIGRLSLGIFGSNRMAEAEPLADDLGVAMQLTNILRDVREDLERGRLYVASEDLERFGCTRQTLAGSPTGPAVALIRFEADRARAWFRRGLGLLGQLDRRSAACAGAMAGIYLHLLKRIEDRPQDVLAGRIELPRWEKALVAGEALAGRVA